MAIIHPLHVFLKTPGKARLLVKEKGLLAGCRVAGEVFRIVDKYLKFEPFIKDGTEI